MNDNDSDRADYPATLKKKFLSHLFTMCELDLGFLVCYIYVMRD